LLLALLALFVNNNKLFLPYQKLQLDKLSVYFNLLPFPFPLVVLVGCRHHQQKQQQRRVA